MSPAVLTLAAIAAIAPTIAAVASLVVALKNGTRLGEVHELVNSRLTAALDKIERLERRLQVLTGEAPTGEPAQKASDLVPRRNDAPQKPEAGEQHDRSA